MFGDGVYAGSPEDSDDAFSWKLVYILFIDMHIHIYAYFHNYSPHKLSARAQNKTTGRRERVEGAPQR